MTEEYIEKVKKLLETNSQRKTAKILGVDHSTVGYWLKNDFKSKKQSPSDYITDCLEYAFLLGFYLGDGTISKARRTYKLRIFNTFEYVNINEYIENCMKVVFPHNKPNRCKKIGAWEIYVYNNNMLSCFPQYGAGRKHNRLIELSDWQKKIVETYPQEFIKGLIYSDGCIVYSNGYKRYEFSNRSEDIHNILNYALRLINVYPTSTRRKTQNKKSDLYNYSVTTISKKEEVDKLSVFIPDKS